MEVKGALLLIGVPRQQAEPRTVPGSQADKSGTATLPQTSTPLLPLEGDLPHSDLSKMANPRHIISLLKDDLLSPCHTHEEGVKYWEK